VVRDLDHADLFGCVWQKPAGGFPLGDQPVVSLAACGRVVRPEVVPPGVDLDEGEVVAVPAALATIGRGFFCRGGGGVRFTVAISRLSEPYTV